MKNHISYFDKYYHYCGIAAPLNYFLLVIVLGAFEPGYSHISNMMSVLGGVPGFRGFLFNLGITTTGLFIAFFSIGLHREIKKWSGSNAGSILILIGSIGLTFSGIFSCNENCVNIFIENTRVGTLHSVSALIAGMGLSMAPFFIYTPFKKNSFWKKFTAYTLITGFLANIPGIIFWISLLTTRLPEIEGLIQRLGITFVFIWIEIISLHLYRSSKQHNKIKKMETKIKIIDAKKQAKLLNSLPKYLNSKRKVLEGNFGIEKTKIALKVANKVYPEIVRNIPTFNTPMYDALICLASKMATLKKGMRAAGISTEEFVKFNIEQTRSDANKIPGFLRRIGGRIYLSSPMRKYLNTVAKSVTSNGWPTLLINGTRQDDFTMSIETRNCQMVAFWESIGEGDIKPYCSFFDFTSAELLGVGLKQVSAIDSGVCKYCFYKKGNVCWPDAVKNILAN